VVKILSQSGITLADAYNVVGSIAGIDELLSNEVSLVHDLSGTLFSERYVTTFRRIISGDVLQSTNIDIIIANLPATPTRLLGLCVMADDASRVSVAAVSVRDPLASGGQEIPIWVWDRTNATVARFDDQGTVGAHEIMHGIPELTSVPTMIGGSGQGPGMVDGIALHAQSSAFGAGTVEMTVLMYFGFAFQQGLSSKGLPFPSW